MRSRSGLSARASGLRAGALVLAASATLAGCKRKVTEDSASPYVVTAEASDLERQNLLAVCQAAVQLLEEGAADRATRLGELALPMSSDPSLVDGLRATEPPLRMGVMKALIKKYDVMKDCQAGLPAFEKGPPRPEELPPEASQPPPGGGNPAPPGVNGQPPTTPGAPLAPPPAPRAGPGAPLPPR